MGENAQALMERLGPAIRNQPIPLVGEFSD